MRIGCDVHYGYWVGRDAWGAECARELQVRRMRIGCDVHRGFREGRDERGARLGHGMGFGLGVRARGAKAGGRRCVGELEIGALTV
jgi:hypothetical protein